VKIIELSHSLLPVYKNELILASRGNQTELYEIVFPRGKGLAAHIHTAGEDCALVLSGNLTYYVETGKPFRWNRADSFSAGKMCCTDI